jgi:hypothetical protein
LPGPPEIGQEMTCHSLPDHRPFYLDYEGSISGDRGSVTRWDQGTYRVKRQDDMEWVVELEGEKLKGIATLQWEAKDFKEWIFSFRGR